MTIAHDTIDSMDQWRAQWLAARDNPDAFWLDVALRRIDWVTPPTQGLEGGYDTIADGPISWFGDGTLNVTTSCLDRHAAQNPDKTAIIWASDEPGQGLHISYQSLLDQVCQTANTLKALGIQKGDRVIIYMGMVPQAAIAMLALSLIHI